MDLSLYIATQALAMLEPWYEDPQRAAELACDLSDKLLAEWQRRRGVI